MIEPVIIGPCTLYLGDCLEVLPTLQGIDAVVTDPPYGLKMNGGTWRLANHPEYQRWDSTAAIIPSLPEVPTVIWGGNYFPLPPSRGWLVWWKRDAVRTMSDCELAWTNKNANTRLLDWTIAATNAERVNHPTQKPVRVMTWSMEQLPISNTCTVLDPYMGSGTTGIACIRTGRKFIGVELDHGYFKLACDRIRRELQQHTLGL